MKYINIEYEKLLLAIVKEYGKNNCLKVHEYYLKNLAKDDFLIVKPNKKEKCIKLFVDNIPF
jgi:hypothetical protein